MEDTSTRDARNDSECGWVGKIPAQWCKCLVLARVPLIYNGTSVLRRSRCTKLTRALEMGLRMRTDSTDRRVYRC